MTLCAILFLDIIMLPSCSTVRVTSLYLIKGAHYGSCMLLFCVLDKRRFTSSSRVLLLLILESGS